MDIKNIKRFKVKKFKNRYQKKKNIKYIAKKFNEIKKKTYRNEKSRNFKSSQVIIQPHRHEGIFIARGKDDQLLTLSYDLEKSVYGEKRIQAFFKGESKQFRVWNPYRSKLGASVLNGIKKIPISPGMKILYLGAASGTTVSHVSDIIGNTGVVYAVEFANRPGRELCSMAQRRNNIVPIIEDARMPNKYRLLVQMVDGIFSDVAQPDQTEIVMKNADMFLKKGGLLMIIIKASCVDTLAIPEEVFANEINKLRIEGYNPQEQQTLEPYQRHHAVITALI